MDGVELIMKVEQAFGISIANTEAERMYTVGQMHDLVWSKVQHMPSLRCNSQHVFYRLRQTLADRFDIPQASLKLNTSLNESFPRDNRREKYGVLGDLMELDLPGLRLPHRPRFFLNLFGGVAIGGTLVAAIVSYFLDGPFWVYFLPVAGIILTIQVSKALDPMRTEIHPNALGEFTEEVVSLNIKHLSQKNGLNRREVEEIINRVIVNKIGVDEVEVVPSARFTDDLGVD